MEIKRGELVINPSEAKIIQACYACGKRLFADEMVLDVTHKGGIANALRLLCEACAKKDNRP